MCLLSIGLDTLALLLRVWLWISVPMAVIILMVATWMNYLRNVRPRDDLKLAIEAFGGEVSPDSGDLYIRREDLVGDGEALPGQGGETVRGDGSVADFTEALAAEGDEEELTATGRETIYQGILWMKQKYEQYRDLADRRYEQMREELGRSERRYQDLLATIEQNRSSAPGTVTDNRIEELESQLRSERTKVGELVAILQTNTRMLQKVIPELGR